MAKAERYIANGIKFKSFEEVEKYASENNYRVSNTETLKKGVYLIALNHK